MQKDQLTIQALRIRKLQTRCLAFVITLRLQLLLPISPFLQLFLAHLIPLSLIIGFPVQLLFHWALLRIICMRLLCIFVPLRSYMRPKAFAHLLLLEITQSLLFTRHLSRKLILSINLHIVRTLPLSMPLHMLLPIPYLLPHPIQFWLLLLLTMPRPMPLFLPHLLSLTQLMLRSHRLPVSLLLLLSIPLSLTITWPLRHTLLLQPLLPFLLPMPHLLSLSLTLWLRLQHPFTKKLPMRLVYCLLLPLQIPLSLLPIRPLLVRLSL